MDTTKKILAGIACAFLPLILLSFGSLMSLYQTLGDAGNVKDALATSGIYSAVVREGLDHLGQDASVQTAGNIPVDRPEVRAIIEQAIPPAFLQQQTNGVIDGLYAWLQGDTPTLQFEVNLTDAKTKLADGLAAYAAQRMDSLPACTALDDLGANYDPFNATCVPAGLDKAAAAQQVRSDIMDNQQFLSDPVINAQDLHTNNPQEVKIGDVRLNRNLYNQTKTNLYITGVSALVLGAAIVLLSRTRRVGVRRLGVIAVAVGGISALLAGFVSLVLNALAKRLAESADANVLQKSVLDAVRLLTQGIRNWWLLYGLGLLGAGIVALVVLAATRRKQPETPLATVQSPPESLAKPAPQKPEDKIKYPKE